MDYLKFGGKPPPAVRRCSAASRSRRAATTITTCTTTASTRTTAAAGCPAAARSPPSPPPPVPPPTTASRSSSRSARCCRHGRGYGAAVNDYVCGGGPAQDVWVNQSRCAALHVPTNSLFFSGDNGAGMTYVPTEKNLMPFYQHVAKNTPCVRRVQRRHRPRPELAARRELDGRLGFEATQSWRPWTMDNCLRVGGYVTRCEKDRFDFQAIRGSGHMVPSSSRRRRSSSSRRGSTTRTTSRTCRVRATK